ncbi:MAG: DUF362 domain-containing protein [SAR324 cluster bacterium]|nr:DUF362 domain-containing protein [SAR324 cluster bacterium]
MIQGWEKAGREKAAAERADGKTGEDPRKPPLQHPEYVKAPLTRRAFVRRALAATGLGAGAAYLALAPEHWPGSLRDGTGLRSKPVHKPFRLPDYRVAKPAGSPDVAIGRGFGGSIGGDGAAASPGGASPDRVMATPAALNLRKALDALGGISHYIRPGDVVLVKPNVAFDRSPNLGATTHPDILEALVRMLLVDARAAEVRVADNPIESPADCFAKSGVGRAAETAGGRVYLPDGNAFRMLHTPGAELIESWWFFQRPLAGVNKVIGVAPAKDHNLCQASLGIKNWYGLLGGRRNQFHQRIHQIVSDLSIMIRPTLTIVDGTRVLMRNGPTGGDPTNVKAGDAVLAAVDPVAQDAWAYEHLLERTDAPPEYLKLAEAKGSGKRDYRGRIREVT